MCRAVCTCALACGCVAGFRIAGRTGAPKASGGGDLEAALENLLCKAGAKQKEQELVQEDLNKLLSDLGLARFFPVDVWPVRLQISQTGMGVMNFALRRHRPP